MNLSDKTRAEQVLAYLSARHGQWVNGMEIMNEEVGGQRGGARVKDLRDQGHIIESRRHPNPAIDQWQYRLVDEPTVSPLRRGEDRPLVFGRDIVCPACKGKGDYSGGYLEDGTTPKPRVPCRTCGGTRVIRWSPGVTR